MHPPGPPKRGRRRQRKGGAAFLKRHFFFFLQRGRQGQRPERPSHVLPTPASAPTPCQLCPSPPSRLPGPTPGPLAPPESRCWGSTPAPRGASSAPPAPPAAPQASSHHLRQGAAAPPLQPGAPARPPCRSEGPQWRQPPLAAPAGGRAGKAGGTQSGSGGGRERVSPCCSVPRTSAAAWQEQRSG